MFWMHSISLRDHGTLSHINNSELFSEIGFNLNQTSDGELATELSITKADWGQLKADVSFQEYVSCDKDVVMCEAQTLEK
jgi:DNA-directed RNA polymerase specialized sigma subunit